MRLAGWKQEYPYPKTARSGVDVVLRNIAMGTSLNSRRAIQALDIQAMEVVETVGAVENNG
jgi:hypothetical protein